MFHNQDGASNGLVVGSGAGNYNVPPMNPTHQQQPQQNINYNGIPQQQQQQQQLQLQQQQLQLQQQQLQQQQQQQPEIIRNIRRKPFAKVIEQPAGKALRFRYECEGRSAGSIPGVHSTPQKKTFPAIEVCNFKGRAVVVVSCVTKDPPYRPHPHNLVGREGCKKGVFTTEINTDTMKAVFSNLGIQCVKKKDIESALKIRDGIRVDPFKTGFSHRFQPNSIDLNAVRLCFQVFIEGNQKGRFNDPLFPIVSEPIFDKKAISELAIQHVCGCSATVLGRSEITLLCEKVVKEDIAVRFFEEKNGHVVWEGYGEFQYVDVHKQTAITLKTPRYHKQDITEPAKVFIQLKRPSDGVTSEALPFEYMPLDSDRDNLRRKRQNISDNPTQLLMQQGNMTSRIRRNISAVKSELSDSSPPPFVVNRAPTEPSPSPQLVDLPTYNNNNNNIGGQLISPGQVHHQYNGGGVGANVGIVVGGNSNVSPMPINMQLYNVYAQQNQHQQQPQQHQQQPHQQQPQQQQQHQQQPQQEQPQQQQPQPQQQQHQQLQHQQQPQQQQQQLQYQQLQHAGSHAQQQHFQGNHIFQNIVHTTNQQWNLVSHIHNPQQQLRMQYQQQQQLQQHQPPYQPTHQQQHYQINQQQQQQQQYHQIIQQQQYQYQANVNNGTVAAVVDGVESSSPNNSKVGPTVSNLLNIDSGQLMHINSEDLELSNLSI